MYQQDEDLRKTCKPIQFTLGTTCDKLFGAVIIKDYKTGDNRVAFIQSEVEGKVNDYDTASNGV